MCRGGNMLVFCYGALLNLKMWQDKKYLGIEPKFICRAMLRGCELIFDGKSLRSGASTANLKANREKRVWGVIFEIKEEDVVKLDTYEGVPVNYIRKQFRVQDDMGENYEVWIYHRPNLRPGKPNQEYLNMLIEGASDYMLPIEYIDQLKKNETA